MSATPQEQAREILAEPRFRDGTLPRPLHGAFEAIGQRLRPVADAFDALVGLLDDLIPGGRSLVWLALAVIVLLAATYGARMSLRRRLTVLDRGRASTLAAAVGRPPEELERDADAAEAAGDLDAALRLRFAAGLGRLAAGGVVEVRPSTSNAELAGRLGRPEFDRLARRFDATVYGRRPAREADLAESRADWAALLTPAPA